MLAAAKESELRKDEKANAAGPATRPHSYVDSCADLVTAWWRNDCLGPTALPKECRICQSQAASSSSCDHKPATFTVPAVLFLLRRASGGGGRNAQATSRAYARFLECPPAIHPRESPVAAGSAAIIRQAQELSRFAEPTFSQIVAPRNTKEFNPCAEAVDDETSLWKAEENRELISPRDFSLVCFQ
jgi:hypothetical protein